MFCNNCGKQQSGANTRYCTGCGGSFSEGRSVSTLSTADETLQGYASPDVPREGKALRAARAVNSGLDMAHAILWMVISYITAIGLVASAVGLGMPWYFYIIAILSAINGTRAILGYSYISFF